MKKPNLFFAAFIVFMLFFTGCKKEKFEVTFHPNGGLGRMETQTFKEGVAQALLANVFTNKGCTFTGWNTNANGTGMSYKNQELIQVISNMELFAQWALIDIDGNLYKTVQIGTQCWMKENLRTTKYKTGENIPVIANANEWKYCTSGAMRLHNDNTESTSKYGALYNRHTVSTGNLCPEGWQVPSKADWDILANYLGGTDIAGYKMKTDYSWDNGPSGGNGNGSNESGFSALPAGNCNEGGNFGGLGMMTAFWSSTDGHFRTLFNISAELNGYNLILNTGYSVRCVKE